MIPIKVGEPYSSQNLPPPCLRLLMTLALTLVCRSVSSVRQSGFRKEEGSSYYSERGGMITAINQDFLFAEREREI